MGDAAARLGIGDGSPVGGPSWVVACFSRGGPCWPFRCRPWKRIDQAAFVGSLAGLPSCPVREFRALRVQFAELRFPSCNVQKRGAASFEIVPFWRVQNNNREEEHGLLQLWQLLKASTSLKAAKTHPSADVTRDRGVPDMRTPTSRKHNENRQYLLENLGRH